MKKGLCIILVALMGISLIACGAPAAQETTSTASEISEASNVVVFNDAVLEAGVREAMNKPEGDITIEEAEAVTELTLGIEWQQYIPEETQIKDISGLEHFRNLTSLDLSFHAITDISLLAGLTKLTALSLGGNPIADITPLSGLADLKWLALFNCQADDYSPLSNLVNLDGVMLDYSTIRDISVLSDLTKLHILSLTNTQVSDISPLAALTGLKSLKLEACPITDYSPLVNIYQNLEEKDFTAVFALSEFGFTLIDHDTTAGYKTEVLTVTVNHSDWGVPTMDLEANSVRMSKQMEDAYTLIVGYYPDTQAYVFSMSKDGERLMDYVYDQASGGFTFGLGDRESAETLVKTVLGDALSGDVLLAPIPVFNDTVKSTFGISADALYALPFEKPTFENPTLLNLGFIPDKDNAVCIYEQHEGRYTNIEVHYPEWGEKEYDVRFFTPVNEYGLVVMYYKDEQRFNVAADKGETYAKFDFYVSDNTSIDENASGNMTVEEYFKNMYNDPNIEDVYLYSVLIAQQYIADTFGMSIDELCVLPLGE
jgi:hypothetical protein